LTKNSEFLQREGPYTSIYRSVPRNSGAGEIAIIGLSAADNVGYQKAKKRKAKHAITRKSVMGHESASSAS
jgi:hypothetical protein